MTTARCAVLGCECGCHRAKRRQPPRLWTPEMDNVLRSALTRGDHPRAIAHAMHLTEDSIRHRIKQLGLSCRDGWRTRAELAAALGVTWRAVDRWMHRGQLRVEPHGSRWTRITDVDVRAFVERYAGLLFDAETVTDAALRRLAETATIVNRRTEAHGGCYTGIPRAGIP